MEPTPGRSPHPLGPTWRLWLGEAKARALAAGLSRAQWRLLRPAARRVAGMQGGELVLQALQLHLRQRRRLATRAPVPWTPESAVAALAERKGGASIWGVLRLLQAARRDASSLGSGATPETDAVRVGQGLVLGFAGLEVADIRLPAAVHRSGSATANVLTGPAPRGMEGTRPRRVTVVQNAVGLLGPNGPMPLAWTQHARSLPNTRSVRARDSFLAFLNVLQRRHLALLYRAWGDARPETAFDMVGLTRLQHPVADRLRALAGVAHADLDSADSVPDDIKLAYASTLARRVRSPVALQAMLSQFLGDPVRVEEFSARWLPIPTDQQSRLGWQFSGLGNGAVAGERTWDCSTRFDLIIGPMSARRYRELLPGTQGWAQLQDLLSLYCGPEWSWRIRLTLRADEVPVCRLAQPGCQLGWSSWLARPAHFGPASDLALASGPALGVRRHSSVDAAGPQEPATASAVPTA